MNKFISISLSIIILLGFLLLVIISMNIVTMANGGIGYIFKVNNENYVGNNSVEIYFISWYGCPNGATSSWVLYLVLKYYGNLSVMPHSSKFIPKIHSSIPGLIFLNYTPHSNVLFHFIYLYNQYLNETMNGIPIKNLSSNQAVYLGLQEVKENAPSWVYNIIYFYNIEDKIINLSNWLDSFSLSPSGNNLYYNGA